MSKIYHTQDYLKIRVTTNYDMTEVTSVKLNYNGPNGNDGVWDVVIEDVENGIIYYDVPTGEPLDSVGDWVAWPTLTFNNGKKLSGTPIKFKVYKEGT